MNVNLGIWDKLRKLMVGLLFVAGILAVFFWYLPVIQENQRYRRKLLKVEADYAEAEKTGKQLRSALEAQNDPKTVERMAREKLALARTNEMVVRFEPPAPPRR